MGCIPIHVPSDAQATAIVTGRRVLAVHSIPSGVIGVAVRSTVNYISHGHPSAAYGRKILKAQMLQQLGKESYW